MNGSWLLWAFRGPKAAVNKVNNGTHRGLSGARKPQLTTSKMAPILRTKKKTAHMTTTRSMYCIDAGEDNQHATCTCLLTGRQPSPMQLLRCVRHCTLATPAQPQWHDSHKRRTTHPNMLYQRFLNPGMEYQLCQHSQTDLNIKPVSQRRPRGGSDTRVTTALPTTSEGLEPKHA